MRLDPCFILKRKWEGRKEAGGHRQEERGMREEEGRHGEGGRREEGDDKNEDREGDDDYGQQTTSRNANREEQNLGGKPVFRVSPLLFLLSMGSVC